MYSFNDSLMEDIPGRKTEPKPKSIGELWNKDFPNTEFSSIFVNYWIQPTQVHWASLIFRDVYFCIQKMKQSSTMY